jgi:Domain of unknown function (DUF4424)
MLKTFHVQLAASALLAVALITSALHADDGAASVAAGGIVLRKEPRITMQKEVLTIAVDKVTVDFDFLNDTDSDVTTTVAFPLPPRNYAPYPDNPPPKFDDFKIWVNAQTAPYETELRATHRGHDYARLLQDMRINLDTFAGGESYDKSGELLPNQLAELSAEQTARLKGLDLVVDGGRGALYPNWTLEKLYYWQQTFSTHRVVHIRHTYTPGAGQMQVGSEYFDSDYRPDHPGQNDHNTFMKSFVDGACLSRFRRLKFEWASPGNIVFVDFVDYILTSANTWKTPIRDFQLIVDPANPWEPTRPYFPSLCWNGPIETLKDGRLSVRRQDFLPSKELKVYFFSN